MRHDGRRTVEVAGRLIGALNAHDLEAALLLIDPAAIDDAEPPGAAAERESWLVRWQQLFAGRPDFVIDIEQTVEEGDTVATRYTHRGTRTGRPPRRPATREPFAALAIDMITVRNGRIVEHRGLTTPETRPT